VYKILHKTKNKEYACKIVTKTGLMAEDEDALRSEVAILKSITSPYIVECIDFLEDDKKIYLALELCVGGELLDRIVKKTSYTEAEARLAAHTLLLAVKACHDVMVCHRDLKPENLLLVNSVDDADMKLADFGFAAVCIDDKCLTEQCGTPTYVAPEILRGTPYGVPSDMWSVGVICFVLLSGCPPFYAESEKALFRKIKNGHYDFDPSWDSVSPEAKDLIERLLVVNPDNRMSCDEALNHPWLKKSDKELASHSLASQLVQLRSYNAHRKFRTAIKVVSFLSSYFRLIS
jgi:calcium/calmodulin-dependent protein kinase I